MFFASLFFFREVNLAKGGSYLIQKNNEWLEMNSLLDVMAGCCFCKTMCVISCLHICLRDDVSVSAGCLCWIIFFGKQSFYGNLLFAVALSGGTNNMRGVMFFRGKVSFVGETI